MIFDVLKKKIMGEMREESIQLLPYYQGANNARLAILEMIEELEKENIQINATNSWFGKMWSGRSEKEIRERIAFLSEKDREFKKSGPSKFSKKYSEGFRDGAVVYLNWVLSSEKKEEHSNNCVFWDNGTRCNCFREKVELTPEQKQRLMDSFKDSISVGAHLDVEDSNGSRVSQLEKEDEEQINRVGMTKIMENENFERRILHVRTDRINELRGVLGEKK